jgi:hypothetical protein
MKFLMMCVDLTKVCLCVSLRLIMILNFLLNWYSGGWSPIESTRHCGHQWPIVPALGDYDGEIGGMIARGNWSTRRKPAPVPLCPPQTPHAARTRTRAATVGSQRLTAWATAWPLNKMWLTVTDSEWIHDNFLSLHIQGDPSSYFQAVITLDTIISNFLLRLWQALY